MFPGSGSSVALLSTYLVILDFCFEESLIDVAKSFDGFGDRRLKRTPPNSVVNHQ